MNRNDERDSRWPGASGAKGTALWTLLALPLRFAAASLTIPARIIEAVVGQLISSTDSACEINPPETTPKRGYSNPVRHAEKPARRSISPQDLGRLDLTRIVVLGDGIAAGMGEFGLHEHSQTWSFSAQIMREAGVEMRQRLIEPPGLECPLVTPHGGVKPADLYQTTVLKSYPPTSTPDNLSTPGFTVFDAVSSRAEIPVVRANNKKHTAANLIFGLPALSGPTTANPHSMLEAAVARNPTFALVELGFTDLMEAALGGKTPQPDAMHEILRNYDIILDQLRDTGASVVAMSIPSPLHTAAFSTAASASGVLKTPVDFLLNTYGLRPGDRITVKGLIAIANQILTRSFKPLDDASILREETASDLGNCVDFLNRRLADCAHRRDCRFFDLAQLYWTLSGTGIPIANRTLTGDYLGGFFSLNGIYPGATGQAVIANHIIDFLNNSHGSRLEKIDLDQIARIDAVAQYRPPEGNMWSLDASLSLARVDQIAVEQKAGSGSTRDQINYYEQPAIDEELESPLALPSGFEQELPLTRERCYYGDCIRVLDCKDPASAVFGGSGDLRFDGLTLGGGRVEGSLRIKFSQPENGRARFEVEFVNGVLKAEDGVLTSPGYYQLPLLNAEIVQPPGTRGVGTVELSTGRAPDFRLACILQNSGLGTLAALNPLSIPKPAIVTFSNETGNPRIYGSSWAQFRQRSDGKLDFEFHGTAFVPLGPGALFPLPFASADGQYATVSASGTALHPRLHLSTMEPAGRRDCFDPLIPTNSINEFELCTVKSSFGDKFRLNHPELGEALGRSFLLGRLRIQFGERFGDSIPFNVSFLPPAGFFDNPSFSPLQEIFPSRLTRGLSGHDGNVRFPLRSYGLTNTYLLEDPLDIAWGALNANSGEVIGDFLHRCLIGQDLIFALFRVEPRTPKSSFQFRGKAQFSRGQDDHLRFNMNAAVYIPYPEGFLFPLPDLASGLVIGTDSSLDPYLQIEAVCTQRIPHTMTAGGEYHVRSTRNDDFSYKFAIPSNPSADNPGVFEYTNHSDNDGKFTSRLISSVAFLNADSRSNGATPNVVNFTVLGSWSHDAGGGDHVATVEISRAPGYQYVSIQIDGGRVSNVNTQPDVVTPPLEPIH